MGNSNKSSLRKSQSVPDTQRLALDAPVFDKQKSVSQLRLNQPHEKPGKPGKPGKKNKQHNNEEVPQLVPSDAAFVPEFPLRGELEDLDFHVLDVIARGAYGNVIKVQREDEKKFYAVKVLDKRQIIEEGAIRQCKDEAMIQSMAGEHPFVVKAHEYWQSSGNLYIVLDYVPHGDMFTLWTFHGAFPEKLVQVYIAEMATVIDFLHNASVIYRDVKMENILFNAKGHIQLTDFGLAKWLQGGEQTRTVCGTLQYMAPEVLSVYPYGHSADWWSLGILMYAMLAGRYPVDGADTHTKMAQRVFECDFFLPSNISDLAQDVINSLLTKSPHKRLCDVNSLQDLDFFQGIFFSDLIEQKLNPLDVVPEDFFPMTGHSWAPQLLTPDEQSNFDQFDDNNDNFTDDHGDLRPASYIQQSLAPQHHPDPVVRLQPTQSHQQEQQHMYGRHRSSPSEQPPYLQHPGDKQSGHQHHPGDKLYGHQHHPGDKQYSHQNPQHPQDQKKPFADYPGSVAGHDSGHIDVNVGGNPTTSDRRLGFTPNLSAVKNVNKGNKQNDLHQTRHDSLDSFIQRSNADASYKNNSIGMNGGSEHIARSNSSLDRRSNGVGVSGSSDPSRTTTNSLGLASSKTALSNANPPAENTNRISAEYKTVEAPPTMTLKTVLPSSSTHPKNNQNRLSYGAPANLGTSAVSGSAPQDFEVSKQGLRFTASSHKPDYHIPGHDGRINPPSEGIGMSGDNRGVDQGYKSFEVAPTITLPSPQIKFNQNPSMPQNNNLQPSMLQDNLHRPQLTTNHFSFPSSTPAGTSFSSTNYGRLEHAAVTLNSTPQMNIGNQRPAVPTKPIPAQRPAVPTKPSVPAKPIPAPRRSLRQKPHSRATHMSETQGRDTTSHQDQNSSVVNVSYPYTFSTGHCQHITPRPQNQTVMNDPSLNPQDWRNTAQPQNRTVVINRSFNPQDWRNTTRLQSQTTMNDSSLNPQDRTNTTQPQNQTVMNVPSLNPQDWTNTTQPQNQTVMNVPSLNPQDQTNTTQPQNRTVMNVPSLNPQDRTNTTQPQNRTVMNVPSLNPQDWTNTKQPQNQTVMNIPSLNPQDWMNTTQPPVTPVDENRPRSGSTSYSRPETASRSLSVESENFEWNLPMGIRPSFV